MLATYSRRTCLLGITAVLAGTAKAAPAGVVAGAIRWDAWYQNTDSSIFAQRNLSWIQYQGRAPKHCGTIDQTFQCIGTQAVIDAEIRAALSGNLKFWAFVWSASNSSFRTAWRLYQSSTLRSSINWCGIVTLAQIGSVPFADMTWKARIEEWADYMRQSHYQKVDTPDGKRRPVLFLLWHPTELQTHFGGSTQNLKAALVHLRGLVAASGIGHPYVVILGGVSEGAHQRECGADALSNYISGFKTEAGGPYLALDEQTRAYWPLLAAAGDAIVPIAMVGWDDRPREEHPVPWETPTKRPSDAISKYYVSPTPTEFADHIQAAVGYIRKNTRACASRLLLIYSWDECDEGGGLVPTRADPSGLYLSAMSRVLS
jgi:hypothetical protein